MRYLKVLLAVIVFFVIITFFTQNQEAFSQVTTLKLSFLDYCKFESIPLPFYTLLILSFVLGGILIFLMLIGDKLALAGRLSAMKLRVSTLESQLKKYQEAADSVKENK
ncbi:MAG: lipopolysaccharide assembly protein LapA domain-containing protein [Desulfovibrionaceae bacterium]|nr:lipopolysaccharide assembly protein LapA domain-containing protein [Desulfovibrionaceae bacterium]